MKVPRKIDRITLLASIGNINSPLRRVYLRNSEGTSSARTNAQWSPNANRNSNVAIYVFRNRRIAQFEASRLGKLL